ncbi:hypothetical protein FKN04_12655 [Bacillus glycinifermentans]|uniref:hypothetical protein n=1 Tax=Bacillus glycinifermentans TaxID=1664069 RepID=UPI001582B00E|nr:hypothetical protein [Bacillus glycinifermentans]NUJ17426.1 hypothetical protein [Bacillus glycinifermentans]
MKKFSGTKKLDDVISNAKMKGWVVDTEKFDKTGSDWIYLRDMYGKVESNDGMPRQIAYNTTNGHFFVYEPLSDKPVATHLSTDFDNECWYNEILNMVYKPITN